jgi:trans-aconitate methyltransferase
MRSTPLSTTPTASVCPTAFLRAVPGRARRILEVGCGDGHRGRLLKRAVPHRQVVGIDRDPARVARAAQRLD